MNNNLLLGEKTFRFSCEHRHEHAVFAHASPLLKAINPSPTVRLFRAKKETLHNSSQMTDDINLKKKLTFKNTIYHAVASSLSHKIPFNSAIRLHDR